MEVPIKWREFEMDFSLIFMFIGIAILSSLSCKNWTVEMIEKIGTDSRYYPKHYVALSKRMKKIIRVRQQMIPRYLYFELLLSFFFLILGPTNIVISIVTNYDEATMRGLVFLHSCLIIANATFFLFTSWVFKKG